MVERLHMKRRELNRAEIAIFDEIAEAAARFREIIETSPSIVPSRAASLALTKIDEAEMWAKRALAGD